MEKIYENFKKDESSIAKWNWAELFCYFLLKSVCENKNKLELYWNWLKDMSIIYHSYWWSQKCDLESIISFENLNYSWHIYVESKHYEDNGSRDKSLEWSAKEFIKRKINIDFLDFYLIFTPWQASINKAIDYLNILKDSKDCKFPRVWWQITDKDISKKDSDYIQKIIKTNIFTDKKRIDVEKIDEVYSILLKNSIFKKVSNSFLEVLQRSLEECYNHYTRDLVFDEFWFNEFYSKPNLEDIITRDELVKKIEEFFSLITDNEEIKKRAIEHFDAYLLRKYWYQKELFYFQKIERIEKLIYNDLVEYLMDNIFDDVKCFNKEIKEAYSSISDQERLVFIKTVVTWYMEKVWLFYANVENIKILDGWNNFYLKKEND